MEEISQEALLERCGAVLRELAQETPRTTQQTRIWNEVRAIVAMLPAPDPDKAIMREIVDRHLAACSYGTDAMFMELLNRGRELAKARAGEGSV